MAALEKHYTVAEVAALWKVSEDTIRRTFYDQPGVLRLGTQESRTKRGYVLLRIPESILQKVHAERRACR